MRFSQLCLLLTFSGACQLALSDFYVGAGGGLSEFDYENIDDGTATKAYVGYQFTNTVYGVELAYIDSGDGDIDDSGRLDLSLSVEGVNLSFVFNSALEPGKTQPFNGYLKAGAYSVDTTLGNSFDKIEDSSNGLSLGLGADYYFSDTFALRGDVTMLAGVEDFSDDGTLTLITLGATFRF